MSWFSIFGAEVIFGGLRICDASIDWQFACNIGGPTSGNSFCKTFPDSTCNFSPSGVFSSFQCTTTTTNPSAFYSGCPGSERFYVDYKFRQSNVIAEGPGVNVSVVATFNCEEVVVERNGTGLFITVQDNTSKPGCSLSGGISSSTLLSNSVSSTYRPSNITTPTLTSSASIQTSTLLTTRTYTVTSCPSKDACTLNSVTTEVLTSYTTFCPSISAPMSLPQASSQGQTTSCDNCISRQSSSGNISFSQPKKTSSVVFASAPSQILVSGGSSNALRKVSVWYPAMIHLFSLPSALAFFDTADVKTTSSSNILKRIPIADLTGIKLFGTTLISTLESNLATNPTIKTSLLGSRITLVTINICEAGKRNLNLYGAEWTTMPKLKLLAFMLGDCIKTMDTMDQDLLLYYTQEQLKVVPEGVLFLKFAGIMYCNRLIAPLVDAASVLDGICGLTA